jgi:hypothetical protein
MSVRSSPRVSTRGVTARTTRWTLARTDDQRPERQRSGNRGARSRGRSQMRTSPSAGMINRAIPGSRQVASSLSHCHPEVGVGVEIPGDQTRQAINAMPAVARCGPPQRCDRIISLHSRANATRPPTTIARAVL